MEFHKRMLYQVYNLCLHNVCSLHPPCVCKVMTFSIHPLLIKLLTLHTLTHTFNVCHYVVISALMVIFMAFNSYPAS